MKAYRIQITPRKYLVALETPEHTLTTGTTITESPEVVAETDGPAFVEALLNGIEQRWVAKRILKAVQHGFHKLHVPLVDVADIPGDLRFDGASAMKAPVRIALEKVRKISWKLPHDRKPIADLTDGEVEDIRTARAALAEFEAAMREQRKDS